MTKVEFAAVAGRLGLRQGLIATGIMTAAVLLPLIWRVLRFRGPDELGLGRDGEGPSNATMVGSLPAVEAPRGRRLLLWSAATGFALGLTVQIGFITHHVALAEPLLGASGAGLLVSATGMSAFLGRLLLARVVDRVDVRRLACLIMVAQAAALLAISVRPTVPVIVVASLVYGYGIGHITTLGPVVIRREFGAAAFGTTYGAAATAIQLTSAFGPVLLGLLRDTFGGYGPGLVAAAGVTTIGCLALAIGRHFSRRDS